MAVHDFAEHRQFQRDPEALDFYLAMQFVVDRLAPQLREGELRVLLFIVRQTAGWGKVRDTISIGQLMDGIGDREGTGMGKRAVIRSYTSLEAKGLVHIIRSRCQGRKPSADLRTYAADRGEGKTQGLRQDRHADADDAARGGASGGVGGEPATPGADRGRWRGWGSRGSFKAEARIRKTAGWGSKDSTFRAQGGIPKTPGWYPKDTRVGS